MRGGNPQEVADVLARARLNAGRGAAESPLERFERLAEAFRQETGILAPGKDYPPGAHPPSDAERAERWAAWLQERRRPLPAPAAPPPEEPEPAPNSPADAGYLDQERLAGGLVTPAARPAPAHLPKTCSSCSAPILWAQVLELDEHGRWSRVKNETTGRMKSMPVDFQPNPDGNVVLFHREGEGIVCRVLKKNEAPPPGARLRTSHFATCPNAKQHRHRKGRR